MAKLLSGLPENVADGEDLARFLMSDSQFNSTMVKPSAFLPEPKARETSVFLHGGQPREALWGIGVEYLPPGRTIHGAAGLKARSVRDAGLDVIADEPALRHAAIRNWPLGMILLN
jgi:hypothetical protein